MELRQFDLAQKAFNRVKENSQREVMETIRFAGWMPANMLSEKSLKPTDFFKFPWESSPRRTTPYTHEEQEDFLKKMKPEWLPNL